MANTGTDNALQNVAIWMAEKCVKCEDGRLRANEAYASYAAWMRGSERGYIYSRAVFGRALGRLGVPKMHSGTTIYLGLALKAEAAEAG